MHSTLYIALFAGLGGMIGWDRPTSLPRKRSTVSGRSKASCGHTCLERHPVGGFFDPNSYGHSGNLPSNVSSWLALAFFGVLQMIVYWLAYQGFEKGKYRCSTRYSLRIPASLPFWLSPCLARKRTCYPLLVW